MKEELKGVRQQDEVHITAAKVKKQLRKMPNWKAPGPDGLQGYWLKNFTSYHERIAEQLQQCLAMNEIPKWLTTGRTSLIIKEVENVGLKGVYQTKLCG